MIAWLKHIVNHRKVIQIKMLYNARRSHFQFTCKSKSVGMAGIIPERICAPAIYMISERVHVPERV